jgi:hypothetical protein
MRVNRGGQLAPEEVFGRDGFIADLWRELEQQSVVLTAERRTGKTCVVKKMQANPPDDVLAFFEDLEWVHSTTEFIEEVVRCTTPEISRTARARKAFEEFWNSVGGTEIAGILKFPESRQPEWKHLLTRVLENLLKHHPGRIVFFWDEFPQMLQNIAQDNPGDAMEILDLLRTLRQQNPRLRFVYTGSIGFHSVLSYLQRRGYRNAPKNDMHAALLPPLVKEDGIDLARELLLGERIPVSEDEITAIATEIAEEAGCIPFYIHQIVGDLRGKADVSFGTARAVVNTGLAAPHDPWEMRHYRTRIDHDYEGGDSAYALAVLDVLGASETPLAFMEIAARAKARPGITDDEQLRSVLKHLEQDHYISKSAETGRYAFRTSLICRWWRLERDL